MIAITQFSGESPKLSEELLPGDYAVAAVNCDLESGSLRAMKGVTSVQGVNADTQTVFKADTAKFMQWSSVVNVVRSFVSSADRWMYTGDGYPKDTNATIGLSSSPYPTASRRLGIPAPSNALTITLIGTAGSEITRTTSYVYTIVGKWADGTEVESAPSAATAVTTIYDGITARLTGFTDATATGAYTTHFRLYRINAGDSGAEYQYVTELAKATTQYDDTVTDDDLGEVLPTTGWTAPIDTLTGLTATSHGMLFGFYQNTVYPSETFIPYAFPEDYTLKTESSVVGLGYTGSMVIVLTGTVPYLLTGQDPSTLSIRRLGYPQACVSARSIVSVPGGVIYASPDGLFFVEESGTGSLITKNLFTKAQWSALTPANLVGFYYDGSYVGFFSGTTSGFRMDLATSRLQSFTLTQNFYGGTYSPEDDQLYLIQTSGAARAVVSWQTGSTVDYTWKSKPVTFSAVRAYTAGMIQGDFTAGNVTFKFYVDGTEVTSQTITSDDVFRIPAVLGERFQVQVSGKATIHRVLVGRSVTEVVSWRGNGA